MGKRGKLPQRGLQRRKSRQQALDQAMTKGQIEVDNESPFEPDEKWHPIAMSLYESVQHSGQSEFYTESDWAKCYMVCDQLSQNLKPQFVGFAEDWKVITVGGEEQAVSYQKPIAGVRPMNGATMNALQSAMASLGIAEGDRRRMGIELARAKPKDAEDPVAEAMKRLREDMKAGTVVDINKNQAASR